MKSFVILLFVGLAFGVGLRNDGGFFFRLRSAQSLNYPIANVTVTTPDGYLLDLFRVNSATQQQEQKPNKRGENRPVVLLMHGFLSSADDFFLTGTHQGLAYYLANKGYDVFVGNSRGNIYARKHTKLNPDRDSAFWQFCWNDIGTKDLPAIIDKIISLTGQEKIHYIGHMQGSTVFYVMASERPEYMSKIEKMVSLGPVAYMGHASNEVIKTVESHMTSKSWLMKNLGVNEFKPSEDFIREVSKSCRSANYNEKFCSSIFFLFNGYNSRNYNSKVVDYVLKNMPQGASTRQILHYAQMAQSGRFEKYSESGTAEEYDLSRVTVPVSLFYTTEDFISYEEDVEILRTKLPTVYVEKFTQFTNNLDLLYAENVEDVVFTKITSYLQKDL